MTKARTALHEAFHTGTYSLGALRTIAGMSDIEAAKLVCVSPHTWRRWKTDRKPNPCAVKLLALAGGFIPWLGWERWFFNRHDRCLYTDDLKYGFSVGDLSRYHYLLQSHDSLLVENQSLKQRLRDLGQPVRLEEDPVHDSPNVVAFPTPLPTLKHIPASESPIRDRKPGLADRFRGFIRKVAG